MNKYDLTIHVPGLSFTGTLADWNDQCAEGHKLPIPLNHSLGTPAMCDILPCLESIFKHCKSEDLDVEIYWYSLENNGPQVAFDTETGTLHDKRTIRTTRLKE